jgi:hypothetical protein
MNKTFNFFINVLPKWAHMSFYKDASLKASLPAQRRND